MTCIREVSLHDFRGFRERRVLQVEADIVLLAGKNGVGKSSLMQAMSLLLNGYDPRVLGDLDLVNIHERGAEAEVICSGGTTSWSFSGKQKDWQGYQRPQIELSPSLARVASAYFQDAATELAGDDFLNYLTGAGNQGVEISDWLKTTAKSWRELATATLPDEKDWDAHRKAILERMVEIGKDSPLSPSVQNAYVGFDPLLESNNLKKRWQSQVVSFAAKLLERETEAYGAQILAQLSQRLRQMKDELKTQQQKPEVENGKLYRLLTELLQANPDNVHAYSGGRLEEVRKELASREVALQRARNQLEQLKRCEPKTTAIQSILTELTENRDEALGELRRLRDVPVPPPHGIVQFFDSIDTVDFDFETLERDYGKWLFEIDEKAKPVAAKIATESAVIQRMKREIDLSEQLQADPNATWFSDANEIRLSGEHAERMNATSSEDLVTTDPAAGLDELDRCVSQLLSLEEEAESFARRRKTEQSFQQAKMFAESWAQAFDRESNARTGEFLRILNDLSLADVIDELRQVLSIFQLPSEFTNAVAFKTKGSGKKAQIVPMLNDLDFSNLSTGQKTLFALGWTIVLNSSLRKRLGHSVMLFDDITTSLDLNQLTPACVLFRRLAYATTVEKRRQLFVSCHHEDLTNHLIDNLIPPEGRSMRVLEFTGYSVEKGPVIDSWDVACAKGGNLGP